MKVKLSHEWNGTKNGQQNQRFEKEEVWKAKELRKESMLVHNYMIHK